MIEAKRDHGLEFDKVRYEPTMARVIEVFKATGVGENPIERLFNEWERFEVRRPTPTDDEADALTVIQADLVEAAVDIVPTNLGELRSQMEFVRATGRGVMDPYDWAAFPAIENAVNFLREPA